MQILFAASFAHNIVTFFQLREETFPRDGKLGMANRPPNKTDFFNVYSSYSSNRETNSLQVSHRNEYSDESLAVLQTTNRSYPAGKQWNERHDQRVPFHMTETCTVAGKENGGFGVPREGPSSSNFVLQKERFTDTENKRSTSQILALFSSHKNTPPPKMTRNGQTAGMNEVNSGVMKGTRLCNLYDTADKFPSKVDAAKVFAQATNDFEISNVSQPSILDNDSVGQVLRSEDLGDSPNLSPDSFAACSSENVGCHLLGGDVSCENITQESTFTRSPDSNQRQSKVWSQNDSESVSPLIRLLTSVEKADPRGCVDVNEDGGQLCLNTVRAHSRLDQCRFESPDSAAVGSPPSLLNSPTSPNVYSLQQSSHGVQNAAHEAVRSSDFVQASSLLGGDMSCCRPGNIAPLITAKDDVSTSYEDMQPSQPKLNRFSMNSTLLSSHPESLFPYSKLQSQDQNNILNNSPDSSLLRKGFSGFEHWDSSFKQQAIDDVQVNFQEYEMSPVFYPETEKKFVATKVTPTDSRAVSIMSTCIANYAYWDKLFACNPISIGDTRYGKILNST